MEIKAIKTTLEINESKLTVRDVEYKSAEDKEKYGVSFEALAKDDYVTVIVNGLTFRTKRIIEEYGSILFIYNGNEVKTLPAYIETLEIL